MKRDPERVVSDRWTAEAIRRRPAKYIGSLNEYGLANLLEIILANAVEEFHHGGATRIDVVRHRDGSLSVSDDGRGIPDGTEPASGLPRLTLAFTCITAGALRSEREPRWTHAHCSHLISVAALSEWLEVSVRRSGYVQQQRFECGVPAGPIRTEPTNDGDDTGTAVRWMPDGSILEQTRYRPDALRNRLRTVAYLAAGLRLTFRDELEDEFVEFYAPDGLAGFVECLNTGRTTLHAPAFARVEEGEFRVGLAFQYHRDDETRILGFLNHRLMAKGGTHLRALQRGIPRAVTEAAREAGRLSADCKDVPFEKAAAGLTAVVSVHHPRPECEGMTAENMGHLELTPLLVDLISKCLSAELARSSHLRQNLFWGIGTAK